MLCLNLGDIVIITNRKVDNRFVIFDISKSDAIYSLENSVLDDLGIYKMHIKEISLKNRVYNYNFNNLIKAKN